MKLLLLLFDIHEVEYNQYSLEHDFANYYYLFENFIHF